MLVVFAKIVVSLVSLVVLHMLYLLLSKQFVHVKTAHVLFVFTWLFSVLLLSLQFDDNGSRVISNTVTNDMLTNCVTIGVIAGIVSFLPISAYLFCTGSIDFASFVCNMASGALLLSVINVYVY
jgi:hypothetical protein